MGITRDGGVYLCLAVMSLKDQNLVEMKTERRPYQGQVQNMFDVVRFELIMDNSELEDLR